MNISTLQLLQAAYTTFGSNLQRGSGSELEISQLLLILSDGRGVFADGVQVCKLRKIIIVELILFIFLVIEGHDWEIE